MSDSVRLHRRQPTRVPLPWDSPGKNTGVGCHFLLQCMKVKSKSEVKSLSRVRLLAPHGLQPTRLLHPWDFPCKSTGVGCHCLLWIVTANTLVIFSVLGTVLSTYIQTILTTLWQDCENTFHLTQYKHAATVFKWKKLSRSSMSLKKIKVMFLQTAPLQWTHRFLKALCPVHEQSRLKASFFLAS